MAGNLLLFLIFLKGKFLLPGAWPSAAGELWQAIPASLGLALTGVINSQLSATTKARLVFLRWSNPLPGCEAFSRYASSDARVDVGALERKVGPFPVEPRAQNDLWYKLFKSVESQAAIVQGHQAFLFTRDYACLAFLMVIVLGVAALVQNPDGKSTALYFGFLALQYLLTRRSARNNGQRLVGSVLAAKSAEA